MRFSSVENQSAYRAIVDQVYDAILRGDLHEDDWLPSEREIAVQSGLSRSSVREALRVLGDAGVVRMKVGTGGGTQIIDDSIPHELIGAAIEVSHQRLLNLFELRNMFEIFAAEMSAARATATDIQDLEALVRQMEQLIKEHPRDREEYTRIDIAFHQRVMKATRNDLLVDKYTSVLREVLPVLDMTDLVEMESYGLPTMRDFVDAVKRRDPMSARLAMHAHVEPLFGLVEGYFKLTQKAAQPTADSARASR